MLSGERAVAADDRRRRRAGDKGFKGAHGFGVAAFVGLHGFVMVSHDFVMAAHGFVVASHGFVMAAFVGVALLVEDAGPVLVGADHGADAVPYADGGDGGVDGGNDGSGGTDDGGVDHGGEAVRLFSHM